MKVKSSHRIDEFLPTYHFNEIHSIHVDASASRCYQAVKTVTPAEMFAFYWSVIRPGSALIRRRWLKAIRNRAEART